MLELITPPASEPVSVAQMTSYLRLLNNTENETFSEIITAARNYFEERTGRQLITATWKYSLDYWPACGEIKLPRSPIQSVSSITYVDVDGDTQTADTSVYQVSTGGDYNVPMIAPAYGQFWPSTRVSTYNAVQVTFIAGYGDAASDVPAEIKRAIIALAAFFRQYPEAASLKAGSNPVKLPFGLESTIANYRTEKVV